MQKLPEALLHSHIMFITIEHIKNIGISKFENT